MTRWLVEADELHVITQDTPAKIGNLSQRQDSVAVRLRRHMVDEIDHTIFQSADIKAVQDMDNEGTGIVRDHRILDQLSCAIRYATRKPKSPPAVSLATYLLTQTP
jgi:hypothetical protein